MRSLDGSPEKETIANVFINTKNLMEDGYILKEVIEIIANTEFNIEVQVLTLLQFMTGFSQR